MTTPGPVSTPSFTDRIASLADTLPQPDLFAVLGVGAIIILGLILAVFLLRWVLNGSTVLHRKAAMRAMKSDTTPGNKILVATVSGGSGMKLRRAALEAIENFLPEFNFGSPFYLGACPVRIEATDFALSRGDHERLTSAFAESGADLIVWGEARGAADGNVLCFSTPAMLADKTSNGFFAMKLETAPSEWGEQHRRAIAYVAGRRLRPSLGRPSDFRAERLFSIIHSMETLLNDGDMLTGEAGQQLEDDFAAGALHIGDQLKNYDWVNKAVDLRSKALETMKPGEDLLRWSRAKIDLGRAMCLQCEQKFDSAKLQDAMTHIREGVDATRAGPQMALADAGFQALQKAENMLANRRRFSIRWQG